MRTSGSSSTPNRASTVARTWAISASMSAARARAPGLTMKFACISDTLAPPIVCPLRPAASIRRAAWSPSGLRNTLPALGSDSGCDAIRFESSSLMRARAFVASPGGKLIHTAVKMPSGGEPSAWRTLRYPIA